MKGMRVYNLQLVFHPGGPQRCLPTRVLYSATQVYMCHVLGSLLKSAPCLCLTDKILMVSLPPHLPSPVPPSPFPSPLYFFLCWLLLLFSSATKTSAFRAQNSFCRPQPLPCFRASPASPAKSCICPGSRAWAPHVLA